MKFGRFVYKNHQGEHFLKNKWRAATNANTTRRTIFVVSLSIRVVFRKRAEHLTGTRMECSQ